MAQGVRSVVSRPRTCWKQLTSARSQMEDRTIPGTASSCVSTIIAPSILGWSGSTLTLWMSKRLGLTARGMLSSNDQGLLHSDQIRVQRDDRSRQLLGGESQTPSTTRTHAFLGVSWLRVVGLLARLTPTGARSGHEVEGSPEAGRGDAARCALSVPSGGDRGEGRGRPALRIVTSLPYSVCRPPT